MAKTSSALPLIKSSMNAHLFPKKYEVNSKPSQTIPDQAMDVKQIMTRFASGLPIHGAKVPIYNPDTDLPHNFQHLDLAEQQELVEEAANRVKQAQSTLRRIKSIKEQKALETAPTVVPPDSTVQPG